MFYRFLFLFGLLACHAPASAQLMDHLPGRLIVQFGADVDAVKWEAEQSDIHTLRSLGHTANIWLITFDHGAVRETELRARLARDRSVLATQYDRPITLRRQPNDPLYPELWQFNNTGQYDGQPGADLNAEPAWDVATGGMTANGDEIVVAVLDDGTDLSHPDLIDNLWINTGETTG